MTTEVMGTPRDQVTGGRLRCAWKGGAWARGCVLCIPPRLGSAERSFLPLPCELCDRNRVSANASFLTIRLFPNISVATERIQPML